MHRPPRIVLILALLLGCVLPWLAPALPVAAAGGPVWTWGRDSEEMLANGPGLNSRDIPGPALRDGLQLDGVVAVAADYRHTLALKADGTVWAWGWDYYGQLGDGTVREPVDDGTPDQVAGLSDVVAIAAGGHISVALKADGTVWAWGSNYGGRLGIGPQMYGDSFEFPIPQQVSGLSGVVAIDATLDNGYAVKSDGTVWVWGGFCGPCVNTESPPSGWNNSGTALQVAGVGGIVAVTADRNSVIGRRADGTLLAWGENANGELGRATGMHTSVSQPPAEVAGIGGVVAVSLDTSHTLALKSDGTVWAWGLDGNGQLGDGVAGNPGQDPTPRQVAGLANITRIDAGPVTNFAIRADGALFGWGNNPEGQLGLGPGFSANEPSARLVSGMTGVQAVAAGNAHTVAVGTYTPLPDFGDLGTLPQPTATSIRQLARLGVIRGCDQEVSPPRYCPDETTLRAQMAALIVRGMVWSGETPANPFTDQCGEYCIDGELWNAIGVLAAKDVARGYTDGATCAPAAAPCYDPRTAVSRAQVISFVTRAMVTKGYWTFATTDGGVYGNVPGPFVERQGHRVDVVTYVENLGAIPEAGNPTGPFADYDQPATRAWFALVLWQAIRDR